MLVRYLKSLFYRLSFVIKFKTFKRAIKYNENEIIVPTSKGFYKLFAKCPHQGAPLEKAFFNDNVIICSWHGCKIDLFEKGIKHENN